MADDEQTAPADIMTEVPDVPPIPADAALAPDIALAPEAGAPLPEDVVNDEVPPAGPVVADHHDGEMQPPAEVHPEQPDPAKADESAEKDTSAMIAEAAAAASAAAAVASVTEGGVSADATAAALAVKTDDATEKDDMEDDEAKAKRNEQRRKRYREKAEEGSVASRDSKSTRTHEEQLASRRNKDRERYAAMTGKQRQVYNSKRRDQYHRQSEDSRQKRRERERNRYHALGDGDAKDRNGRRAKLERERYQRLSATELEAKNRKRRERAADLRKRSKGGSATSDPPDAFTAGASTKVEEMKVDETAGVNQAEVSAADEAVKEAVKEAVDEAVGKSVTDVVQI